MGIVSRLLGNLNSDFSISDIKEKLDSIKLEEKDEKEKMKENEKKFEDDFSNEAILNYLGIELEELEDITAKLEEVEDELLSETEDLKHEENEVTEKVEEIKEHLDDFDVEGITEFLDELRGRAPFDLERDDPERLKRIRKSTVEEFHQDLEALYSNAKLLEEEINPEINQIEGEILPELFSEIDFLQDLDEEMEDLEIEEIEIEEKLARRNKNRIKHAGGGPVSTDASKNKLDFQSEEVKRTVSELKTIMEKKKRLEKMIKADENLAEKDEKGIVEVLEQIKTDISAIMERLADQNKRGLPLYDLLRREVSDEFEDLHGRVKTYKDHHPNFKPGAPSEEAKVVSSSAAEVKELYESLVELSGSVNEIKREIAG